MQVTGRQSSWLASAGCHGIEPSQMCSPLSPSDNFSSCGTWQLHLRPQQYPSSHTQLTHRRKRDNNTIFFQAKMLSNVLLCSDGEKYPSPKIQITQNFSLYLFTYFHSIIIYYFLYANFCISFSHTKKKKKYSVLMCRHILVLHYPALLPKQVFWAMATCLERSQKSNLQMTRHCVAWIWGSPKGFMWNTEGFLV